jgi:hypothetical protein
MRLHGGFWLGAVVDVLDDRVKGFGRHATCCTFIPVDDPESLPGSKLMGHLTL